MLKFLITVVLLISLSNVAGGQTLAAMSREIADSVTAHNYLLAISKLRELKTKSPRVFEINNYDYLLGRMSERSGDVATAMFAYQVVAKSESVLKPYALWHLSKIARTAGNLILERMYVQELLSNSPDSLLSSAAKNRLARSYFESNDFLGALDTIDSIMPNGAGKKQGSGSSLSRENQVLAGRSLLQLGKTVEARVVFARLLDEMPNPAQPDDFSLAAAEGLDQIDRGAPSPPSDLEDLRRASIFQFNRSFEKARDHYRAIITNYPQSGIVPDATFQIGRGYAQQGELVEAINWFERVQEQFPDHPSSRDALLQAASTYVRLAKYKESVARYKRFIEKYPEDEQVGRAYLNIVDVLRDQGEENDALLWSAKTQTVFHGKVVEALALFSDARLYIARNDWTSALSSLNKLSSMNDLGGAGMPGGTTVQEVSFLRGLALEQSEHFAEAVDVYLTIADGRGEYYGGRATERLRLMANDPEAKGAVDQKVLSLLSGIKSKDPEISRKNLQSIIRLTDSEEDRNQYLATLRTVYRSLPAYNRIPVLAETPLGRTKLAEDSSTQQPSIGDELFFLGLCDEAAPEFEASVISRPAPSQNVSYSLARCELQGNMANRAADFIVPLWKNVPADFQIELIPKEQLAMLYPAPFEELLLRYATSRNVDPRFELAIMRQESGFQPDIKSYAAARGLMQFISTTANTIALKLNRRPFHLEDLYDPSTSILFGSQYLADLFATFPDQPAAVAASYNGGDDNVRRWMLRSKSRSADLYIPEIAYSQSKDYAYRVMANYRIYQYLYDENLNIRH